MSKGHKTRIVHFSSVHGWKDVRVFNKECRTLAAAGYDVTLIARGDMNGVVDGVKVRSLPKSPTGNRFARMVIDTWKVASRAFKVRADLYHFHDPELIPIGLLFRLSGKKVIYDAHEDYRDDILSKTYIPGGMRRFISKTFGVFEDFAIRRFSGVVAATPRIASTLSTNHTVTICNYPLIDEVVNQTVSHSRDHATAIYAGGMTAIRGLQEMVDAMDVANQQQPVNLTLCGEMPESLGDHLKSRPGWQYVNALGQQPREVMYEHLASATCGLVLFHPEPNHVEAMPNKMFEYMAAGLPVVASSFPFWKQFVEDVGSGVRVDPMDPSDIARGILEIVNNPDRARSMSEAGKNAVQEKFNWDSEAVKLVALANRLTGVEKQHVSDSK